MIGSVSLAVIGLATQWITGHFANQKRDQALADALDEVKRQAILDATEADRKASELRREVADAKAEADRKVADAKADADRNRANSKAEIDRLRADADALAERRKAEREFSNGRMLQLQTLIDELTDRQDRTIGHIETAAKGIDKNSAGLKQLAEAAGMTIPIAPKMNGGKGAMDDEILGIGGPPK